MRWTMSFLYSIYNINYYYYYCLPVDALKTIVRYSYLEYARAV